MHFVRGIAIVLLSTCIPEKIAHEMEFQFLSMFFNLLLKKRGQFARRDFTLPKNQMEFLKLLNQLRDVLIW